MSAKPLLISSSSKYLCSAWSTSPDRMRQQQVEQVLWGGWEGRGKDGGHTLVM